MNRVPMTPEGHEKLQKELSHLKSVVRPKNIQDIETARSYGDLSENAEYHAAKEKQGHIAAQIARLETMLSQSEVIDSKHIKPTDKIIFSATVTLYDVDSAEEVTYKIVGDDEGNVKEGKIGISSPLARGLIGKSAGDEVAVKTPKGLRQFEIIKVAYV
ncbi:MAG: transcription elongation factor GreA [Deltaproteobacteria bacterium]|nr:transcription elongation factor GreA [Deltaproteobacteria bacterium]